MKAILISLVLASALCACKSAVPEGRMDSVCADIPPLPEGVHNAQNSLDYHGVYKSADLSGAFMEVELAPGGVYRLRDALGNLKTGKYQWDSSGRVVTLLGSGLPDLSFFVGENRLWLGAAAHTGQLFIKQNS